MTFGKAYILSCQDRSSSPVAERIRAAVFLATPHRGSDSARLLNSVLRASGSWRSLSYVADLQRNSPSLQIISDEFKMYADDLLLWSFYEARKTRLGLSRRFIVDKDSAMLGYKNEKVMYLSTDHRGTSRFDGPTDPNYGLVRNTLAHAIERVTKGYRNTTTKFSFTELANTKRPKSADMPTLSSYLATTDDHESDLSDLEESTGKETCHWFCDKKPFQHWISDVTSARSLYWVTSKPGTGKSVLAAYSVGYLRNTGRNCAFYFFRHGDKTKKLSSSFLRSLAYQLASMNREVRELLLSMHNDDIRFDRDDCRAIWRTLFVGRILDVPITTPQYLVIDGLDECSDAANVLALLGKIESKFPVRILVSSRPTLEYRRYFGDWTSNVTHCEINATDTLRDIRIFLEQEARLWSVFDARKRRKLVDKIITRSEGSFLWAQLVLREISPGPSEQQIDIILDSVPAEMESLYSRSLEKIAATVREKDIARSVLVWAVSAFRPMRDDELRDAIFYDTGKNIYGFDASIEPQYGHLISFHQKSRTIGIVHSTAREFLLKNNNAEFAMTRSAGHLRLATVCLKYLISVEMQPPRHPYQALRQRRFPKSAFADYACTAFSEHLANASSADDNLPVLLSSFLRTNVLSWIQHILENHNLYYLIRTGKNLRRYLERRAKHSAPLGPEFQFAHGWSTDLVRLAAKFGRQMMDFPGAIHFLVPPFCPSESLIYRQLDEKGAIAVQESHETNWEDCVAWIEYRDSWAMSLACGENIFALGMKSGDVLLYNQSTCQCVSTLQHLEPIKVLKFDHSSSWLVSAGAKHLRLWNLNGFHAWTYDLEDPCVGISFAEDRRSLIVVMRSNKGVELNIDNGSELRRHEFTGSSDILASTSHQAPLAVSVSPDFSILAIVYRGRPIHLWSLQGHKKLIGFCGRDVGKANPGISAGTVLFNPNPNINLLAIAYQDGELALHDPWTQKELVSVDGDALSLASSPDGRTLASADGHGTIQLWDFETLTLLHRMSGCEQGLDKLAFSHDGFRIMDIRYTVTQVWEPSVLVRKDFEEDSSASDLAQLPVPTATFDSGLPTELAAIISHRSSSVVFAATSDGSVVYFDSTSGKEFGKLYNHPKGLSTTHLTWNGPGNILVSADNEGRILGRRVKEEDDRWSVSSPLLNLKARCPVRQVVLNPSGSHMLVSAGHRDTLWQVSASQGRPVIVGQMKFPSDKSRRWTLLPCDSTRLVLLVDAEFRVFAWDTLKEVCRVSLFSAAGFGNDLVDTVQASLCLFPFTDNDSSTYIVAGLTPLEDQLSSSPFYVWNSSLFTGDTPAAGTTRDPVTLHGIKYVLGVRGSRLYFLDDDFWVCTYDLGALKNVPAGETRLRGETCQRQRHFFIPYDFASRSSGILATLTADGSIAFARRGQIIVVRCEWGMLLDHN